MRRLLASLTAPLLAVSLLAGCGGADETSSSQEPSNDTSSSAPAEDESQDPTATENPAENAPGAESEYCKLLGTDFASMFANIKGPEDVTKAIGMIKQIGSAAPDEVADEWNLMQGALGQVENAMTQAARLQQQAAEGDVSPEELQKQTEKLTKDMESLDTPANAKAGDAVAKHAEEYCGLALG